MAALATPGAIHKGAPHGAMAVAVSGGSDSIALMHLLGDWARDRKVPPPAVLTVDHGFRAGSLAEARVVVRVAGKAGLKGHVLRWRGAKPKSNIEAAARDARYLLLGAWCVTHKVMSLFVAHTRDDQAETFLLRLARGSGVDGLSAMQPRTPSLLGLGAAEIVRPLLGFSRAELRAYLTARGETWIEDPMNGEERFARVRVRALWPQLEAAGLTRERIAAAAEHMARARTALEAQGRAFLTAHMAVADDGAVLVDAKALGEAPREIGLRALAAILTGVGGQPYRPRFDRLQRLYHDAVSARPGTRTLHGCRVGPAPKRHQRFGPATLMISAEPPRKPPRGPRGKSPQNRHIPAVACA